MERRLFIIRHGKSSWDHQGLDDIDRPLADRGIRNAAEMARRLQEKGLVPELLLSSPASRALNTALIMLRNWQLDPTKLQIHDSLYDAYLKEIEEVVATVPAEGHSTGHLRAQSLFYLVSQSIPAKSPWTTCPQQGWWL
jgi:phosphohistidine phosphatase